MRTIKVNETEYTLEYSFASAEHKETVQKMFNVVSGAYLVKQITNENANAEAMASAMIDGTSEMVADIPNIVRTAFYSGLLENHSVSEAEAYEIMKAYMKENKISFRKLFEDIKACMEEDGFFDLSGLTEMLQEMNTEMQTVKAPKTTSKKKSTGTK